MIVRPFAARWPAAATSSCALLVLENFILTGADLEPSSSTQLSLLSRVQSFALNHHYQPSTRPRSRGEHVKRPTPR